MRRPYIGGNWKMNLMRDSAAALARAIDAGADAFAGRADLAIFPPFIYLEAAAAEIDPAAIHLGAQDFWPEPPGAFTGEISLDMLREVGVSGVLVGHSERRHIVGEDDALINRKVRAAMDGGFQCILCIGETRTQREAGETDAVNRRQLGAALRDVPIAHARHQLIIAYEPVWAIGTGLNATPQDAQAAHRAIRVELASRYDAEAAQAVRIIYGGSVKPGNAAELFENQPDIDGFLVGGASLDAEGFLAIARAALS